jgi:hypothetical protein
MRGVINEYEETFAFGAPGTIMFYVMRPGSVLVIAHCRGAFIMILRTGALCSPAECDVRLYGRRRIPNTSLCQNNISIGETGKSRQAVTWKAAVLVRRRNG